MSNADKKSDISERYWGLLWPQETHLANWGVFEPTKRDSKDIFTHRVVSGDKKSDISERYWGRPEEAQGVWRHSCD